MSRGLEWSLRFLSEAAVRAGVGASVNALIRELMRTGLSVMLEGMAAGGRQAVIRLTGAGLEHKLASHIIALATFGLSSLVDGVTRAYVLSRSARDAEVFSRPWATGAMETAALYLATDRGRRCAAELFGRVIYADGRVDAREVDLLAAHLNRFHRVEGRWETSSPAEQATLADLAAEAGRPGQSDLVASDIEGCIDDLYRRQESLERLTILAGILLFALVDQDYSPEERDLYQWYTGRLTDGVGTANFDIPEDHLSFVERHMKVALLDEELAEDDATATELSSLSVEQRLPFLEAVPTDLENMVACALGGESCPNR